MSGEATLDPHVASAFYGQFSKLRPAQEASIEPLLKGRNLVLSAGTGSGKTEAVVAPIVSRLRSAALISDDVAIVYIAPTKALANDLERRLHPVLSTLGLRVGVRHGDRDDLVRGLNPHLLLTTPESLDVLLFRKDKHLLQVRAVVLDEVHLFYNTQRGLQLSILLKRLQQVCSGPIQVAMLSATVGRLSDVATFILGKESLAQNISFPPERVIDAHIRHASSEDSFLEVIRRLAGDAPTKLLVFANSRQECERLAGILGRDEVLARKTFAHYSSLSTEVRVETERRYAGASSAICVATSTLELGIDIGDIDAVLLWGVPGNVESFLQRIGRGNRRSSKTNVVCLVPDDSANIVMDALRFAILVQAGKMGELSIRSPYELFGAFAQQALGFIASDGGSSKRVADLSALVAHTGYLSRPVVEAILGELQSKDYLVPHGYKNRYRSGENLHKLVDYRLIYGNFGAGSQTVAVQQGAKNLGEVPAVNLLRLVKGSVVRFAGKRWQILSASSESIQVVPAGRGGDSIDFMYPGRGIGWDSFLSSRLWSLIHSDKVPIDLFSRDLAAGVVKFLNAARASWTAHTIPYIREPDGVRYLTFAGYMVNKAVGLITEKADFRADDLSLKTPSLIEWESIPTKPENFEIVYDRLFEVTAEQSLYQSLLPPALQRREFLQDWLRDETIAPTLVRLQAAKAAETTLSI